MKRSLILAAGVMVVSALAWVSFGQSEGSTSRRGTEASRGRARAGVWRQYQFKAIAAIEEQLAKMKSALESSSAGREDWQNLSQEERNKLREQFRKMREERQKSIAVIEEELARLEGRRRLQRRHEESIGKLNNILELARKEKATETAAAVEKLIADQKKAFQEKIEKLNLPLRTRSRNNQAPAVGR